jgi:NADH/NAD ratio-sensing transcriptional regulator Rex
MRKVLIVIAGILCFGSMFAQESKDFVIKAFTDGIINFAEGELSAYSPISSVNKISKKQAAKIIVITKENMAESLEESKNHKACIITVSDHCIIKITDFNKTIMSRSWGCEFPFVDAYIQTGTLKFKQDYCNNIIGMPNYQILTMFLFD